MKLLIHLIFSVLLSSSVQANLTNKTIEGVITSIEKDHIIIVTKRLYKTKLPKTLFKSGYRVGDSIRIDITEDEFTEILEINTVKK